MVCCGAARAGHRRYRQPLGADRRDNVRADRPTGGVRIAGRGHRHEPECSAADPNGAWYTSGVRIGTPALTTRGFGADEFDKVAELIVNVLNDTTP